MIRSFAGQGSLDVFDGADTKAARKTCPKELWRLAQRKLDQLNRVVSIDELRVPPGNRMEKLQAGRAHQHSIRINDQYRVCFIWEDGHAEQVEIVDYH